MESAAIYRTQSGAQTRLKKVRAYLRGGVLVPVALIYACLIVVSRQLLPAGRRENYTVRMQRIALSTLRRGMAARVRVSGVIPPSGADSGAYLIVPNHLSWIDPFLIGSVFRASMVADEQYNSWPIIGFLIRSMGAILVARKRTLDTRNFMSQVSSRLARGTNVIIFGEGRTSRGESLRPFASGPFEAVVGLQNVAIVPVYMDLVRVDGRPAVGDIRDLVCWYWDESGWRPPFWGHVFRFLGTSGADFVIRIGEPIQAADHDRKRLAELSHDAVARLAIAAHPELHEK